jgi:hypothetical protein
VAKKVSSLFVFFLGFGAKSKSAVNQPSPNADGDSVNRLHLETERAFTRSPIAMFPIEKDALVGPASIEILARVSAQAGEPDRAITALQKLLSIPYGGGPAGIPLTPALLRLDPMFDPLRNNPRFQKLVASPTPKPERALLYPRGPRISHGAQKGND